MSAELHPFLHVSFETFMCSSELWCSSYCWCDHWTSELFLLGKETSHLVVKGTTSEHRHAAVTPSRACFPCMKAVTLETQVQFQHVALCCIMSPLPPPFCSHSVYEEKKASATFAGLLWTQALNQVSTLISPLYIFFIPNHLWTWNCRVWSDDSVRSPSLLHDPFHPSVTPRPI